MDKLNELMCVIGIIEKNDRENDQPIRAFSKIMEALQILRLNIDSRDSFPGDQRFIFAEQVSFTDVLYWYLYCASRRGYSVDKLIMDLEIKLRHMQKENTIEVMQPQVKNENNTGNHETDKTN